MNRGCSVAASELFAKRAIQLQPVALTPVQSTAAPERVQACLSVQDVT